MYKFSFHEQFKHSGHDCILFLMTFLFSCSQYTEQINVVLKQAGKNCKELEKVLQHYGKNPADSLKLRAAEFLIMNMPGKYSVYYDAPWNDVAKVRIINPALIPKVVTPHVLLFYATQKQCTCCKPE